MEYRNKKTGFTFFSNCKIGGKDWEEVNPNEKTEEPAENDEIPSVTPVEKNADDHRDSDGITVKEIKQELDAMGIKYDPKLKKQELYDLMMAKGE